MKPHDIFSRMKNLFLICAAYYLVTWFTGCPVKYFLGISCPGCGMTRAWLSLLRFDLSGAFACHPLFWTAPFIAIAFLYEDQIDFRRYRWVLIGTAALFLTVYIVRLFYFPNSIVVWEPENGVIYQNIRHLPRVLKLM